MTNITFLDRLNFQTPDENFDFARFNSVGKLTFYDHTSDDEIIENSQGADVIVVSKVRLPAETIQQLKHIKLICKFGTGLDRIDVGTAKACGIGVINFPGYGTTMVAQWTITLLLTIASSITQYNQAVKQGQWQEKKFTYPMIEIANKTLGIMGYGHIGKEVAKLAHKLGMRVLVSTRYPDDNASVSFVSDQQLYQESDFLCLMGLLNEQTKDKINQTVFQQLQPSCFIINTARAGLINKADLITALENKQIAGIALDGYWQEPPDEHDPLFQFDNVIITPHMASSSHGTRQKLINLIAEKIQNYFNQ